MFILAVITAVGSLGGLGGIVVMIFRAGEVRQEVRETRRQVAEIHERGCNYIHQQPHVRAAAATTEGAGAD